MGILLPWYWLNLGSAPVGPILFPGLEYTLKNGKAHYTLPPGRLHYTLKRED